MNIFKHKTSTIKNPAAEQLNATSDSSVPRGGLILGDYNISSSLYSDITLIYIPNKKPYENVQNTLPDKGVKSEQEKPAG